MQTSQYHIFALPSELLDSLRPRHLVNRPPSRPHTPESVPATNPGARACNVCQGIVFLTVDDQRSHFRSDWHRYNVKTRINGGQAVSEAGFSQLLDKLEESLSGSASSDDEGEESDAISNLVNKANRLATRSPSPESSSNKLPPSPLTWFHSPPSTQLGFYRAILPLKLEQTGYLNEVRKMQTPVLNGRKWAMFMVAGGHFAGAIVRVSRAEEDEAEEQSGRKAKQKKPKPDTEVLLHKTFHRYTTRRKQGGSQSTNDNAKGPAKSAGALLRRYGEQALRDDIRGLLEIWLEEIAQCERIWIRASASNRRIFYDYEAAPWVKNDMRLRTFPFPTRRPTQSELVRCLMELIRPKVSHFTEEELHEQDQAYLSSLPKPKHMPTVTQRGPEKEKQHKPVLSKEEEAQREKWSRLLEMVTKGRLDALKSFLTREGGAIGGVDAAVPEWTGFKQTTILQLAVVHGHEEVVQWMLEEARADPTIPLSFHRSAADGDDDDEEIMDPNADLVGPSRGARRTAYDFAQTKPVRDAFRRAAAAHPDWWDWLGAGHVPSALSQAMEEEKEEKKKVRKKGLKDRIKERQAKADENVEEPQIVNQMPVQKLDSSSFTQRLGGTSGTSDGISGLTPEMRAKVERERRARAAEARLTKLTLNSNKIT